MNDFDHAKSMLSLASYDLNALKGMLDPNVFAENIFGFHAQQSVEKTLKAWISALNGTYPHIHDIEELIIILKSMNCNVEGMEDYVYFNPYAVQFRYTEYDILDGTLDRNDTINKVQALYDHVSEVIREIERNG
ncbi:MAG: HEPN domain-containing protein [Nitrospirae bacterium]|nr:HEPN domain-containing protein [Nitrospirota bacterium]